MSSSVYVKFFSNDRDYLGSRYYDFLKYKLEDVVPENILKDPGKEYNEEYFGLIPKDKINLEDFEYSFDKTFLRKGVDLNKYTPVKFNMEELLKNKKEIEKEYENVYYWKEEKYNGEWYSASSFENAFEKSSFKIENLYNQLFELKNLKKSINYYKLSIEEKDDLENDIINLLEDIESENYKIYAYKCMVMLMEDELREQYKLDYNDKILAYISIVY